MISVGTALRALKDLKVAVHGYMAKLHERPAELADDLRRLAEETKE